MHNVDSLNEFEQPLTWRKARENVMFYFTGAAGL